MFAPITTAAMLLLLFLTPSCGYVSSLRDFYRLDRDSTRTLPSTPSVLDHPQRSHQCYSYGHGRLTLAATNDPVDPLSLASVFSSQLQLSAELIDRLQEYIDKWRLEASLLGGMSTTYVANDSNSSIANVVEKNENLLAMFQPSGFYKDQVALELASRADKSVPYDPHPLSYVLLRQLGYDDLVEPIMSLGGPLEVSKMMGLDWTPRRQVFDERLRPKRVDSYAMDIAGSLLLGSAFEERLEAAAALDLSVIKTKLSHSDGALDRSEEEGIGGLGVVNQQQMYNKDLKQMRMTWSELNDLERREQRVAERFQLNPVERINLAFTCLLTGFAWGHATNELLNLHSIDSSAVDTMRLLSSALLTANIVSAGAAVKVAVDKSRDWKLWMVRSFLGGVQSLVIVRGLDDKLIVAAKTSER